MKRKGHGRWGGVFYCSVAPLVGLNCPPLPSAVTWGDSKNGAVKAEAKPFTTIFLLCRWSLTNNTSIHGPPSFRFVSFRFPDEGATVVPAPWGFSFLNSIYLFMPRSLARWAF